MVDGISAEALAPLVIQAVRAAWLWKSGRDAAQAEASKELAEAQRLAQHLLGSLLFEVKSHVEKMRRLVAGTDASGDALDFSVTDALFPQFCQIAPNPRLLDDLRVILAAARRVDFFLRLQAQERCEIVVVGDSATRLALTQAALEAAKEGAQRDRDEVRSRFNFLVDTAEQMGEANYDDGWPALRDAFVPQRVEAK